MTRLSARLPRFPAIAVLALAGAVLGLLFSPVQAQERDEVLPSVSEGDVDLPNDNNTPGRVAVGGSATGAIWIPKDQDRFAVELVAGHTYRFDLTGRPGGGGTLRDTYFRAIYNSEGRYQSGSYNDDFDGGRDSRVTFTPTQSGTYYARVSGDRNETGTYTLSVTDVTAEQGAGPPDKPRGLEATATHDSVTLTWDNPQDDTITGYVILRRVRVNNTGGDFSVLVSDTGTAALTYTDDTVAASLTYTYRIKAINEHGVSERSRWFHVDTPAAPEPEEEQAAEPPDKPRGLETTATHSSVTLTWDDPQDDSITGYVILRRVPGVDPQGHFNELVSNTGTDATTYTDDTVSAETRYTYRIKAINEHGTSERSRWSHIDVPAAPEAVEGDDPDGEDGKGDGGGAPGGPGKRANVAEPSDGDCAAGASTTCEVDVGGSVTGNIGSAGDYDCEVDLEAGTRYQFDLEGAPTERGTLDDPFLGLYNPLSLATIAANDKGGVGNNSRMTYTVTATGTYYIDVSQSTDASAGTYTLSVIVLGANGASEADTDFPNNNTTSGKVEVGASVTGNVESATDKDWFEVDLEAGKRYQFDLEGAPNGRGTQPDPYLVLYDGSANDIRDNDDLTPGNFNSAIVYDITATGTYYLEARGATIADTGTYTLSVSDVTPAVLPDDPPVDDSETEEDDLAADTSTSGVVEVDGAAVGGDIYKPVFVERTGDDDVDGWDFDTDWFAVELEEDRTYRIDMRGAMLSTDTDLTLRLPQINAIYDSDGDSLVNTFDRDESDSHYLFRVTFHAHADGTYYIAASGESFEWGSYKLRVKDVTAGPASKPAVASEPPGLAPNVPNPFNPGTVIPYRLDADGPVRLDIYNLLGQRIRTLVDEVQAAGAYRVRWEARDGRGAAVATGVYFIRLQHPGGVQTRRMLYLK